MHAPSTTGQARRRLRAVNCSSVPDTLLESELFGHLRGSFTGAMRDHQGVFEAANGGTVVLDEISDSSPRMQGLLLRFLQFGELQRIGETARPGTLTSGSWPRRIATCSNGLLRASFDSISTIA